MERGVALRLLADLEAAGLVTPVSLDLPDEITVAQFDSLCAFFGHLSHATRWWVGDLICWGEGRYRERVAQAATLFGLAEGTCQNYASVCDRVPAKRRRVGVPFHVHQLVASLEPEQQEKWLGEADKNGWSHRETRLAMEAANEAPAPAAQPAWSTAESAATTGAGAAEPGGGAAAAMGAPAPSLNGDGPTYPVVLARVRDRYETQIDARKTDGFGNALNLMRDDLLEEERDALNWALEQLAPELA